MPAAVFFTEGDASDASADVGVWVGIALDSAPGASLGNAAFTDISSLLVSFSTQRGRQYELDQIDTSTLNILLNSPAGILDPANVSSPYYPSLRPLRQIRVLRHSAGVIYYRFSGPIERYEPRWLAPRNDTVGIVGTQQMSLTADDGWEVLANRFLVSDQFSSLTTALTGADNDLTFTALEAGPSGDMITVTYDVSGTSTSLDTGTNADTIGGLLITSSPTDISSTRGTPAQTQPASIVAVAGSDITVTVATSGGGAATSTANDILAACAANPDIAKLVTVSLAPGSTGVGVVTAMAQTALTGGTWTEEVSGTRITRALDLVGWPADARDLDIGLFEICPGGFGQADKKSAKDHIQEVAYGELGYTFLDGAGNLVFHDGTHRETFSTSTSSQATFSDDGVGFPYYGEPGLTLDRDRIYNDVTVTGGLNTAIPQNAQDATSQTEFEVRSYSLSTQLNNDADAASIASAIITASSEPPSIRFTQINLLDPGGPVTTIVTSSAGTYGGGDFGGGIYGTGDGTETTVTFEVGPDEWLQAVLAREIGDRVTVRTNPPGHTTTVAYDCFIEAISDNVTPGGSFNDGAFWQTSFMLTPIAATSSGGGGGGGGTGGALLDRNGIDMVLNSGPLG